MTPPCYVLARGSESPHADELLWQLVADDAHIVRESAEAPGEVGRTAGEVRGARALAGERVLGLFQGEHIAIGLSDQVLGAADRLLVLARR